MADVFTKKKRSEIMSRIRAKNTGIEKIIFSHLRKRRIYFQMHYDRVAGKPDIALPSKRKAVFINGDFWHGYRFRTWMHRIPKKYWRKKIQSNIDRDRNNYRGLRRKGWKVLVVWGHQIFRDSDGASATVASFLKK